MADVPPSDLGRATIPGLGRPYVRQRAANPRGTPSKPEKKTAVPAGAPTSRLPSGPPQVVVPRLGKIPPAAALYVLSVADPCSPWMTEGTLDRSVQEERADGSQDSDNSPDKDLGASAPFSRRERTVLRGRRPDGRRRPRHRACRRRESLAVQHLRQQRGAGSAYLEDRHTATADRITHVLERYGTPRERLLGVFDAQTELFSDHGFHGCAFVHASAEARPGSSVERAADEYRAWVRSLFTDLAEQAGAADPKTLGRQLHLLYDGAGLSARMDRDPSAAATARHAATALLDAAIPTSARANLPKRRPQTRQARQVLSGATGLPGGVVLQDRRAVHPRDQGAMSHLTSVRRTDAPGLIAYGPRSSNESSLITR